MTDTGRVDSEIREIAGVGAMHCCARVVMASGRAEVGSATPNSVDMGPVEARGEAADMDVHVEDPVGVLREAGLADDDAGNVLHFRGGVQRPARAAGDGGR